jgi:FkbM family methyltransferase
MANDKVNQLLGLLDPSRFPRTTDKILNFLIIGTAIPPAIFWSLAKGVSWTNKFTNLYRELMPRDMLIRYRNCLFLARRDQLEIWLLNPASEPHAFEVFDPGEGDIVVDMGAHVGKYTLSSAKLVGEEGHVFAFEAVPDHYEALESNIELNELSNVTAVNAATYDKNQDMWLVGWDLKPEPDPEHPEEEHINPEGSMPVDAITVDSVLEEHDIQAVDYVKIDIGRQELNAIRGMERTLRASDDVIMLVEIGEENFEDVNALLSELGFIGTALSDSWGENGLKDYIYEK